MMLGINNSEYLKNLKELMKDIALDKYFGNVDKAQGEILQLMMDAYNELGELKKEVR